MKDSGAIATIPRPILEALLRDTETARAQALATSKNLRSVRESAPTHLHAIQELVSEEELSSRFGVLHLTSYMRNSHQLMDRALSDTNRLAFELTALGGMPFNHLIQAKHQSRSRNHADNGVAVPVATLERWLQTLLQWGDRKLFQIRPIHEADAHRHSIHRVNEECERNFTAMAEIDEKEAATHWLRRSGMYRSSALSRWFTESHGNALHSWLEKSLTDLDALHASLAGALSPKPINRQQQLTGTECLDASSPSKQVEGNGIIARLLLNAADPQQPDHVEKERYKREKPRPPGKREGGVEPNRR